MQRPRNFLAVQRVRKGPAIMVVAAAALIALNGSQPVAAAQQASTLASNCQFEPAILAFNRGDAELATPLFETCIGANTEVAASSFYLGILARNARNLPRARTLLTRATELNPASIGYRLELAVTHEWMSNLDQAKQLYQSVLGDDADNIPARVGVARMDHWQGNVARSVKAYQILHKENPDNTGIRSGLAMALMADGKLKQSRALLEQNLAANPNDEGARQGLAMIEKTRKGTVDFYTSDVRAADGQRSQRIQLLLAMQMNYRWRLLAELSSGRQNNTVGADGTNTGNKSVDSEASVAAVYRFSPKTTATVGLKYQHLENSENQFKLQLAGAHDLLPGQTVSYGLIPTITAGRLTSTLGYAGYSYKTAADWVAGGTIYRGWDRNGANSLAGALTIGKEFGTGSSVRIGLSTSKTGAMSASTVFGQFKYPLTKRLAANMRFNQSLSGKEREISLGVHYAF